MDRTRQDGKRCFNCGNFQCYYVKKIYRYDKTQQGYCSIRKQITDKNDSCEKWNKNYLKFYSSKAKAVKVLAEILAELSAVREVLYSEEEVEDDEK